MGEGKASSGPVRSRAERMRRLAELSRLASESLDVQQLCNFVVQATAELLRCDLARLWLLEEQARELRLASQGNAPGLDPPTGAPRRLPLETLIGHVALTQQRRYSPELAEDPLWRNPQWVRDNGYRSQMAVPLVAAGRSIGTLAVVYRRPYRFSADEVELLEAFAAQAAVAIRNAGLFSELSEANEKLERAHRQNELLLTSAGEGIYALDREGRLTFMNPAAARMFEYAIDELIGLPWTALTRGLDTEDAAAAAELQADPLKVEIFRRRDGTTFPADTVVTPIREHGETVGWVVTFKDATERRRAEATLEHRALHDPLTELPNRVLLADRLAQAVATAQREARPCAVMVMDLNRFKQVNDEHGHHVGDVVLQQVAQRLKGVLRASDTFARLGGDEFAAVLPGTDRVGACATAAKLVEAARHPFFVHGHRCELDASVGVALFPEHGTDAEVLLRRADAAMYVAKRSKSGHALHDPVPA